MGKPAKVAMRKQERRVLPFGVFGGGMLQRENQGTWETRWDGQGSKWPESKRWWGIHNSPNGPGRESDLPIVAMKPWKHGRAKGQDFDRVSNKEGRTA
jgi:hypothetical protein